MARPVSPTGAGVSSRRPRPVSAWARLAAQAIGLALFVGLSSASVHMVTWTEAGGRRIAVMPLLAAAMPGVLSGLLAAAGLLAWARGRTDFVEASRRFDPLLLLWIAVVPYVPFVADDLPLTLVAAGRLRWWIALVAGALLVSRHLPRLDGALLVRRVASPRRVFVAALAVYLLVGAAMSRSFGIGGDEPHYLIITQSLLSDGDLRIENNHDQRQYLAFFAGDLRPDFVQRGRDGVIYSIHAPGLPALLLPAYAVAGVRGALVFVSVLAALGAVAAFRVARRVASPRAALAATAAVCGSTPYLFHASMLYPEMPAAVIVAWTLVWLVDDDRRTTVGLWLLRGVTIGALPWLHTKFVTLAPLGLALVWLLLRRRHWRAAAAFTAAAAALVLSWFISFYVMYGTFNPTAPYGPSSAMGYQLAWSNVPRGLLGLCFDQEFGLLLYSPVYVLAAYGAWLARREPSHGERAITAAVLVTVAAFLVGTTRYYMWWGGWSVPARFVIPLLPLAVLPIARTFERARRGTPRAVTAAAALVTALAVGTLVFGMRDLLMFNDRDGSSRLLDYLDASQVAIHLLPSFLWEDWLTPFSRVVSWAVALMFGLTAHWWWCQRRPADAPVELVRLAACVAVAAALVTRAGLSPGAVEGIVQAGRHRLLMTLDPNTRSARDPNTWRALPWRQVVAAATLRLTPTPELSDDPAHAIGPITLPAGRYVGVVRFRGGGRPLTDPVTLRFHRSETMVAAAAAGSERTRRFVFALPAAFTAPRLWLDVGSRGQFEALQALEIQPLDVVPAAARDARVPVVTENLPERAGAYLAYLDRNAFAEHGVFWTRGESTTDVVAVGAGAPVMRLWFEAGAAPGTMSLQIGEGPLESRALRAGERLERSLPFGVDTQATRIRVGFDAGFRPADVDVASADRRWLGVRVGVEPE